MSWWWLFLIAPVSASFGAFISGIRTRKAYDRGYRHGHRAGWTGRNLT